MGDKILFSSFLVIFSFFLCAKKIIHVTFSAGGGRPNEPPNESKAHMSHVRTILVATLIGARGYS